MRRRRHVLELIVLLGVVALVFQYLGPRMEERAGTAPSPGGPTPGAPTLDAPPPGAPPPPGPPPGPAGGQGPNYREGAPWRTVLHDGRPGPRLNLEIRVHGADGKPLPGAVVDVWHADARGTYSQPPETFCRGRARTGPDGRAWFETQRPAAYGPKGMRPHVHWRLQADGYQVRFDQVDVPDGPGPVTSGPGGPTGQLVQDPADPQASLLQVDVGLLPVFPSIVR